jgi:hypothetical protein
MGRGKSEGPDSLVPRECMLAYIFEAVEAWALSLLVPTQPSIEGPMTQADYGMFLAVLVVVRASRKVFRQDRTE